MGTAIAVTVQNGELAHFLFTVVGETENLISHRISDSQTARMNAKEAVALDESLAAFERAVKLVNICNERLEVAKEKIRILTENEDGTTTDAPFTYNEN